MPEYITVIERIERRTYLKGRLTAKFTGSLDAQKSDFRIENFYDIDILDAKISAHKKDFRPWHNNAGEHEEFSDIEKFTTALPSPISCAITGNDGKIKHYSLQVNEPKLINYKLTKKLYERDALFAVIEGEISGYLRHYDIEEKQIKVVPPELKLPEPVMPELKSESILTNPLQNSAPFNSGYPARSIASDSAPYISTDGYDGKSRDRFGFSGRGNGNRGNGWYRFFGWRQPAETNDGCATILGIVVVTYVGFIFFIAIILVLIDLFAELKPLILPFLISAVIPLFPVGTMIYVFVKLQSRLPLFWRWSFQLLIILLIFLMWFD